MNLYMISLKLLIFNSHVKLPEGMSILHSPPSFLELFAGCWWINPAVWVGLLKLAVGKPSGPVLEWPRNRAYTDLCHIDLYYPLFRMIHHISSLFSVHSDHSGNLHVNLVRTCRCKKDVWMQLIIHPESAYISKWMRPQREKEREREIFIPSSKETSFDRNHMFTQKQVILPWDVLGLESALGFVASDTGWGWWWWWSSGKMQGRMPSNGSMYILTSTYIYIYVCVPFGNLT